MGEVRERDYQRRERERVEEKRREERENGSPWKKSQIQTMIKGSSRPSSSSSSRLLLLDEERKMILNLIIPYVIIKSKNITRFQKTLPLSLSLLKGEKE